MLQCFEAWRLRAGGTRGHVRTASCVFAQVVNDCPGCRKRLRVVVESKASQLRDAELFAQNPLGVIALEDPIFETAFHATGSFEQRSLRGFKKLLRAWKKRFAWMEKLQLVAQRLVSIRARKFRGLKFAGREVHKCQSNRRAGRMLRDGGQVIVFARVENGAVGGRTGRDDADDFAAN